MSAEREGPGPVHVGEERPRTPAPAKGRVLIEVERSQDVLSDPRPPYVVEIIDRLTGTAGLLEGARVAIEELERYIIANDPATSISYSARQPLADAKHEAEHAWQHVTSVRRAVRMAWPVEPGGEHEHEPHEPHEPHDNCCAAHAQPPATTSFRPHEHKRHTMEDHR